MVVIVVFCRNYIHFWVRFQAILLCFVVELDLTS